MATGEYITPYDGIRTMNSIEPQRTTGLASIWAVVDNYLAEVEAEKQRRQQFQTMATDTEGKYNSLISSLDTIYREKGQEYQAANPPAPVPTSAYDDQARRNALATFENDPEIRAIRSQGGQRPNWDPEIKAIIDRKYPGMAHYANLPASGPITDYSLNTQYIDPDTPLNQRAGGGGGTWGALYDPTNRLEQWNRNINNQKNNAQAALSGMKGARSQDEFDYYKKQYDSAEAQLKASSKTDLQNDPMYTSGPARAYYTGDNGASVGSATAFESMLNKLVGSGQKPTSEQYETMAGMMNVFTPATGQTFSTPDIASFFNSKLPVKTDISTGTPLFTDVLSKEKIEYGLANAKTYREKLFFLNEADKLRENVIHSSAEYHGASKQYGEMYDLPTAMNPFEIAADTALRQQQITRGINPNSLSFTQLPTKGNYLTALTNNQNEFLRQITNNGINVYGFQKDATGNYILDANGNRVPKAQFIAQAYAGPAGGSFLDPNAVLANVPIQNYEPFVKSVTTKNIDNAINYDFVNNRVSGTNMGFSNGSVVSGLNTGIPGALNASVSAQVSKNNSTITAPVPGGLMLTSALVNGVNNPQEKMNDSDKLKLITNGIAEIGLNFLGPLGLGIREGVATQKFLSENKDTITNTVGQFYPEYKYDIPKVDKNTASTPEYATYAVSAAVSNNLPGGTFTGPMPTPWQGMNLGSTILSVPKSLSNFAGDLFGTSQSKKEFANYEVLNKTYSKNLEDYNKDFDEYQSLQALQSGVWKQAEATGKVKDDTFVYDENDKNDLNIVSSLDTINAKLDAKYSILSEKESALNSQFTALEQSEQKIKDAQTGEQFFSVGGVIDRGIHQPTSGITRFLIPNVSPITQNKEVQRYAGEYLTTIPTFIAPGGSGLSVLVNRAIPQQTKEDVGVGTLGTIQGLTDWSREKPVEVVASYYTGKAFPILEFKGSGLIAKAASSELPVIGRGAQMLSKSGLAADAYGFGTRVVLPGMYAHEVYQDIKGDETTDNSLSGRSQRLGKNIGQFGTFMMGMKSVNLPAVENPYAVRDLDRPSEKARIFLSSRLNAIGMEPGQKTAYLEGIRPYKATRHIQPAKTTEQPDLSHLSRVGRFGDTIEQSMVEVPSVLMGSGVVEAQASNLPTAKLLRPGKDVDLYTHPEEFVMNLAGKTGGILEKSPSPRAEARQVRVGKKVLAVDPHEFPANYPHIPGRKYNVEPGTYNEEVTGLGSILFGEPVKGIPRPEEITIRGKTEGYEGRLNFERLQVQSAKKSEALMKDLQSPMERGYRLDKDLYDSISIKNEQIAVERSRGVTSKREAELKAAEASNEKILDQTITYTTKSGEVRTEPLRDIYNRVQQDVIVARSAGTTSGITEMNFAVPEVPYRGVVGVMDAIPTYTGGLAATIVGTTKENINVPKIREPDFSYKIGIGKSVGGIQDVDSPRILRGSKGSYTGESIEPPGLAKKTKTKYEIEGIIGGKRGKRGISDTSRTKLKQGKRGYQPGEKITPSKANEISVRNEPEWMVNEKKLAKDKEKIKIKDVDSSTGFYSGRGWRDNTHTNYRSKKNKVKLKGSDVTPLPDNYMLSYPKYPKFSTPSLPSYLQSIADAASKPKKSEKSDKSSSPSVSPSGSPSGSSSPYTPSYPYISPYSPSSPISSPVSSPSSYASGPSMPSNPSRPRRVGGAAPYIGPISVGGSGGRGQHGQIIIKNPLRGLEISSPYTNFVVSRGMNRATNTKRVNFVPTPVQRGNASPVVRVNPRININRNVARAPKQPAYNFNMDFVFGGKKKKKGMIF